jgi:hypothetical protein
MRKAGSRLLLGLFRFGIGLVAGTLLECRAQDVAERSA